jgi:chorismate mutase
MSTAEKPDAKPVDRLDVLRGEIDGLDEQIVALVSRRTRLTLAIAEEKRTRGLSTMVGGRHSAVIGNYMGAVPEDSDMTAGNAIQLGEVVMSISREAQDRHRDQLDQADQAERAELSGLAEQAALRQQ